MVELAKDEREMLDGKHGRAQQRSMEILVQYADALGAEPDAGTSLRELAEKVRAARGAAARATGNCAPKAVSNPA